MISSYWSMTHLAQSQSRALNSARNGVLMPKKRCHGCRRRMIDKRSCAACDVKVDDPLRATKMVNAVAEAAIAAVAVAAVAVAAVAGAFDL